MNNVFENQGTTEQKLSMYNDLYVVNNDSVKLANTDKQDILRNIQFIKNKQAYLFDEQLNDSTRQR